MSCSRLGKVMNRGSNSTTPRIRYASIVRYRSGKIPCSVVVQEAGQAGEQQRSDRPSGEDMNP